MTSPPKWFLRVDRTIRMAVVSITCTLIVLMVLFTLYTVVMRYVFKNPPYWGDTLSMFCNIWLVLIAYGLAVRDRQVIATEGIYVFFSRRAVRAIRNSWQVLTFLFGAFLVWFGLDAALNVPGKFMELGGLPKKFPMMALPLSGLLVALGSAAVLAEDLLGWSEPSTENEQPQPIA